MKRLTLLFALVALVCGNALAQFSYNFDDCTAGDKIAQTLGSPWTTWSNAPGGAEDGVFGEAGGSMAANFSYGNDQVLLFDGLTSGAWAVSLDVYIPTGKDGYHNILHTFNGSGSEWGIEVYLKNSSEGTCIKANGGSTSFECPYDTWFNLLYEIDLDNDVATFFVDGTEVLTWQFSTQASGGAGTRQLDAIDFYPPTSAAVSNFFVDNVELTSLSGDEILIEDDFEAYTVGNKIAQDAIAVGNDWWTTWSNAPGGEEDGEVADFDGTQCGHLTYGNDQVLLLGDEENGNYDLEFDILVPEGKNGYFNILHHFAGSNSTWAMQCYLHMTNDGSTSTQAPGHGTIHAGSNGTADVPCVYDAWMHFRLNVNTDTDVAQYYYTAPGESEVLVCEWQWSLDSFGNNTVGRTLGAMDFYPPSNAATSEYYLDNFSFKKIGGDSAPVLSVTPEAIDETLGEDDVTTVEITVENSGNSIGDWMGWIDFGEGGTGSQTSELYYHNGEESQGIGSSSAYTRELGARFPATAYAGSAMGMNIVSAKYLVGTNYQSTDHNYIFRIYNQGMNNQPGELLAEKTVYSTAAGTWITATFDEPIAITGQTFWATVQLEQTAGEYPMTMDGGEYGEESDGNWLSTSGGIFSHCYSAGSFGGAWLLTVNCQGNLINGSWAGLDKYEGSIAGGESDVVTMTLNSIGLDNGVYDANLVMMTNDENLPVIEIPVRLNVDLTAIVETSDMFNIYPNPATSQVIIEGQNLESLAIYNVAGQLVRIVKLGDTINTVDLNVEAGVYFFSIYDNNGNNNVQRVVVTK